MAPSGLLERREREIRTLNLPIDASSHALDESPPASGLSLDESAFRLFYERTSQPLLRYLLAMTRTPDLADDVLQETYCRFLTASLPEMDDRQARSYLFRIATNLMRDRWRRSKEELPPVEGIEIESPSPHLDRTLGVRQAFDRLNPRERQLLWLAYVEGSNHHEIAASTGLGAASIRMLLFRARRKLAELIAKSTAKPKVSK